MTTKNYEELKAKVLELREQRKLDPRPTPAQRADWAYGNTKVEEPSVTREMAEDAVAEKDAV